MDRYCILDMTTDTVVNIVEYAGVPSVPPPGMSSTYRAVRSDDAQIGWRNVGGLLIDQSPQVHIPTNHDVNMQRDRRLLQFSYDGATYNFDAVSQQNIESAAILALAALVDGAKSGDLRWADAGSDFYWITVANEKVTMDAQTVMAFAGAAAAWKRKHIYAARTLKDAGVPSDYADDKHWA